MSETFIGENVSANNEVSHSVIKPLQKEKDNGPLHCDICKVRVSCKKNLWAHLRGEKHAKKLKRLTKEIVPKKNLKNKEINEKKESSLKIMNKSSTSPSTTKSEKEKKYIKSPSMRKSVKEVNPIKSLSLKQNPKTSSVRPESDLYNKNRDYFSQNRFQNKGRGRNNRNNYSYTEWCDSSYSGNSKNCYNNRGFRSYHNPYPWNYNDQRNQFYSFESMENFDEQERHKQLESEISYPKDNKARCNPENIEMSQNHITKARERSLNENRDKVDYNKTVSPELVNRAPKSSLPLKKSQTVKCLNKLSVRVSRLSESSLKNNSTSSNSTKTNYVQGKKDYEGVESVQDNSVRNCDKMALPSTTKNSSDCDRQSDKKAPSENMTDRISHWINPSSLKDKAEIDKLMTEYSKSKKKENLLRLKLHGVKSKSNDTCDNSIETRFQTWEHLQSPLNSIHLAQEKNHTPKTLEGTIPSTDKVADSNCSGTQTVSKSPKAKRRKKSSLSESSLNSKDTIFADSKSPVSRSSSLSRNQTEKKGRRSRASIDSPFHAREELNLDLHVESDYAALGKRRNSFQQINKSKKHKCSASECLEKCVHEEREKLQEELQVSSASFENSLVYSGIYINPDELNLKKETLENLNQVAGGEVVSKEASSEININNTKILDVEDLMKMFAAQNVKIKKEFDDPLIDAIQSMDVNLLLNVCDQQSSLSKEKTTPPNTLPLPQSQSPLSSSNVPSTQSIVNDFNQENNKSSESSLFLSKENTTSKSLLNYDVDNNKLTLHSKNSNSIQNSPLATCDISKDPGSLRVSDSNGIRNSNSFDNIFSGLSPMNVYVNISNELKKLQKEEEEKRAYLKNIEKMIEKHQKILNDLNSAKIKLQTEEDNLISRRKSLTGALSHCISRDSLNASAESDKSSVPSSNANISESLPPKTKLNETNQVSTAAVTKSTLSQINSQIEAPNPTNQSDVVSSTNHSEKQILSKKYSFVEDIEEVIIIPKQDPAIEIPVIDLVESESPEKQRETSNEGNESISSREQAYEIKDFTAHKTVVNSLKVLNHYLYTCANDYTAKRFNLKNLDEIVIYAHKKRNVLHLCVETYKDTTIVFTLCSLDKFISLFKADDGLPLKKYSFEFVAASITNGWGKIFAGLNNGQVVVCNSKETKDLVRNLEPVKSMACTYQGGLHILIILSINGQVAVRDVDRNGLLIRYVKAHSDTPLFMCVYNDYVYLSSAIVLTVTDLTNGSLKRKIKLTSPITGLAAHEHNIFTTSFSGLIRCYPNGQADQMKMAYGVGNSVTSICVSQGWVFTANRNGEIGAFKFDPLPEFHCQLSNCQHVFTRTEDLKRHIFDGIDHPLFNKPIRKCPWKRCGQQFTRKWSAEDKKDHLEYHVNLSEGTVIS